MRASLSLWTLCVTAGILGLWAVWAVVDAITDHVFVSFRSFGLISPLIGLVCLVLSIGGLLQAGRRTAPKWQAGTAALLSVAIIVVPFFALPFDPS